jgi:hypothetical protein
MTQGVKLTFLLISWFIDQQSFAQNKSHHNQTQYIRTIVMAQQIMYICWLI